MLSSIYSAASGIRSQQYRMDTLSNNIANINTVGFKSTRVNFKDALYSTMVNTENPGSNVNLQQGRGVIVGGIKTDYSNAGVQVTENSLDFAIDGSGFFVIEGSDGENYYTRNGAFCLSVEEDGSYLVDSYGNYVLSDTGERIFVENDVTTISVAEDGTISLTHTPEDGGEYIENDYARIAVVDFANLGGLMSAGLGKYTTSVMSGEPMEAESFKLKQGALENSNVDLAEELTLMIRTQRALSFASRALTTSDDMDGLANNMRR